MWEPLVEGTASDRNLWLVTPDTYGEPDGLNVVWLVLGKTPDHFQSVTIPIQMDEIPKVVGALSRRRTVDVGESAQLALERMKHCPQPGEHFRHYKGAEVEVVFTSIMEEDMDVLITYREMSTGRLWTRRFNNFVGHVHTGDHLAPEPVRRFMKVG